MIASLSYFTAMIGATLPLNPSVDTYKWNARATLSDPLAVTQCRFRYDD
jgi:hypothetical protein